ncbi:MAG: hypothetical protein ACKO32_08300, partial [Planctomycetia bacterium]
PPQQVGAGCNNSSSTGGALLSGSGSASVAADALLISVAGTKPTATTVLLQGHTELSLGSGGVAFGQGLRCVGGTLLRLYVTGAVGGAANFPPTGSNSISARSAALGDSLTAGSRRVYMAYYRDPIVSGGCPVSATFNATNALSVAWN